MATRMPSIHRSFRTGRRYCVKRGAEGLILILVIALVMAWPGGLAAAGDGGAGKAVYDKKCATCHGKAGEGNPSMAKMLKVELRHLGSKEVQAKSDADLKKSIVEGTGKMKPVKGLSDADVANVIAYVRTLKQK